jgi:hydroxyisourate hydrolase
MTVDLWRLGEGGARAHVLSLLTNADGRAPAPLLEGDAVVVGQYELVFHVRAYFAAHGVDAPFLGEVPVRFTLFDPAQNYHVPLVTSPWAYSTYRGS